MKKLLFLLIGTLLILAGCASKEEKFLKGKWEGDDNIVTVFDGENETDYKNGKSRGSLPYEIVEVQEDKILVKTYGFDNGGAMFTKYKINKSDNSMYIGDFWFENSSGDIIKAGVGDEVIQKIDNKKEDAMALLFCVVVVIGLIALYYYRNHYKKKKNNDRELL